MSTNTKMAEALRLALPILEHERLKQDASYGGNFSQTRADRARKALDAARATLAAHDAEQAQAAQAVPWKRLARMCWDDLNVCYGELGRNWQATEFSEETVSALRSAFGDAPAAPAPEARAAGQDEREAFEKCAEEIEQLQGTWITTVAASRIVRKHAALAQRPQAAGQELPPGAFLCESNDSPWLICKPCAADGRCARATLAQRQPLTEWRPIETAPEHDEVLLFGQLNRHAFIGSWGRYCRHNQPRITHWMPIPAAPGATTGKEPKG